MKKMITCLDCEHDLIRMWLIGAGNTLFKCPSCSLLVVADRHNEIIEEMRPTQCHGGALE